MSDSSTNQTAHSKVALQHSRVSGLVLTSLKALIYLILLQCSPKNNMKVETLCCFVEFVEFNSQSNFFLNYEENSYSFQKHSCSTIYWLTSDPGLGV